MLFLIFMSLFNLHGCYNWMSWILDTLVMKLNITVRWKWQNGTELNYGINEQYRLAKSTLQNWTSCTTAVHPTDTRRSYFNHSCHPRSHHLKHWWLLSQQHKCCHPCRPPPVGAPRRRRRHPHNAATCGTPNSCSQHRRNAGQMALQHRLQHINSASTNTCSCCRQYLCVLQPWLAQLLWLKLLCIHFCSSTTPFLFEPLLMCASLFFTDLGFCICFHGSKLLLQPLLVCASFIVKTFWFNQLYYVLEPWLVFASFTDIV